MYGELKESEARALIGCFQNFDRGLIVLRVK